ncbi:MAG: calcium sensor EFh [Proteobacteria bacterium]|nr:calcium sensor EFh [Pseudomonadota bacterium]
MNISKLLLVSGVLALPAYAAGGVPDSSMANDGVKPPYGYHAATREACKADPAKCQADAQARRAACQADPAKCLQERAALADERFRKSDADGNGTLSRTEAEKGMPRLARQFDVVDVNRDGQLSREEMRAARKARHGARASHKA